MHAKFDKRSMNQRGPNSTHSNTQLAAARTRLTLHTVFSARKLRMGLAAFVTLLSASLASGPAAIATVSQPEDRPPTRSVEFAALRILPGEGAQANELFEMPMQVMAERQLRSHSSSLHRGDNGNDNNGNSSDIAGSGGGGGDLYLPRPIQLLIEYVLFGGILLMGITNFAVRLINLCGRILRTCWSPPSPQGPQGFDIAALSAEEYEALDELRAAADGLDPREWTACADGGFVRRHCAGSSAVPDSSPSARSSAWRHATDKGFPEKDAHPGVKCDCCTGMCSGHMLGCALLVLVGTVGLLTTPDLLHLVVYAVSGVIWLFGLYVCACAVADIPSVRRVVYSK